MRDVEIVIAADGVHPSLAFRAEQYKQYKENLRRLCAETWQNVRVIEFPEHIHACNTTRAALEQITTPNVFITGHGWLLHGEVPWKRLLDAMEEANSIRFYIFDDIHPDHAHLFDQDRVMVRGVPLMRTIQYADGPAIFRTEWYKDTIARHVSPSSRCFNEDILWPIYHNQGWDGWEKMYVYAPPRMNRNVWFNERETDPSPERLVIPR
jgi:hypothetical protein